MIFFIFVNVLLVAIASTADASPFPESVIYTINHYETGQEMTVNITEICSEFNRIPFDIDPMYKRARCTLYNPVLQPLIDAGLGHPGYMGIHRAMEIAQEDPSNNPNFGRRICRDQGFTCISTDGIEDLGPGCIDVKNNCRRALSHLHKMMFELPPSLSEPTCNNFARKSVRGFFHDYMSRGIEGSILDEHDVSMNFGLCRWSQYINVLSDETGCDPGSVIAMAGTFGYMACGAGLFDMDGTKPYLTINRPYPCGSNIEGSELFDQETKQRKEEFSDAQLASNSTAMEEFWFAANGFFDPRNAEIEYSGSAAAAAHSMGRVTCPPDGVAANGNHANYSLGFFHIPREYNMERYETVYWAGPNTTNLNRYMYQGLSRNQETQCKWADENHPYHGPPLEGKRYGTEEYPLLEGETDINAEGGLCSLPTHFLPIIHVGISLHRIPRWVAGTQHAFQGGRPPFSDHQSQCRDLMNMFIPMELLNLTEFELPVSPALDSFLEIAWDGYDSINSAWDTCDLGCDIPIQQNRLCGGTGLSDFNWRSTDAPTNSPNSSPLANPSALPSSHPSVSPSSIPSGCPMAQPSSAPSPQSCDEPDLGFLMVKMNGSRIWRRCKWLRKNINRCKIRGNWRTCPNTCGKCNKCKDSPYRFKINVKGKTKEKTCNWVMKKKEKRCNIDQFAKSCRKLCGQC